MTERRPGTTVGVRLIEASVNRVDCTRRGGGGDSPYERGGDASRLA